MDYSTLEETELLQLLKDDDESAFREIYVRFHDFLYVYAFKLTKGNEQESQDILQTIFLNLWSKRNELQITGKVFSYLHQSVRYGFLNHERNRSTFSKYQTDLLNYLKEGHIDTDELLFERELIHRLRKLAYDMPGKRGKIFIMFYFDQYSHTEIADVMGISEKTVKNLLSQSSKDLRLKLGFALAFFFLLS